MSNSKNKFIRLAQGAPPMPPGGAPPPMPPAPPGAPDPSTMPMAGPPTAPPTDPPTPVPLDSMTKILSYAGAGAGGSLDLFEDNPDSSSDLAETIWKKFGGTVGPNGEVLGDVDPDKVGQQSADNPDPSPKPFNQNDTPWTLLPIGKTIKDIVSYQQLSNVLHSMPITELKGAAAPAGGPGGGGGAPGGGGPPPGGDSGGPPPGGPPPGGPPPGMAAAIRDRVILANVAEAAGLYKIADLIDYEVARTASRQWTPLIDAALKSAASIKAKIESGYLNSEEKGIYHKLYEECMQMANKFRLQEKEGGTDNISSGHTGLTPQEEHMLIGAEHGETEPASEGTPNYFDADRYLDSHRIRLHQ